MKYKIDYTKQVRYEYMKGREAVAAIRDCPVGYLPIGCLERHGDHLPMGLDVIKAYGVCCLVAQAVGGVVFPPHHYAGIHQMTEEQMDRSTGQWGNIYTDRTAEDHLIDVIDQFARAGVKVMVLYSGHYPVSQVDMIENIAAHFAKGSKIRIISFAERMIMDGDHAGVSETSFMLYLDKSQVNMTAFSDANYQDHGWGGGKDPQNASVTQGEESVQQVIAHLATEIEKALVE